ncbi:hypothetical protein LTR28_012192 [Elasticomyces elasticus]|nr:hypothetical protein LTR28_012192 [Elasticomyces elasticus]
MRCLPPGFGKGKPGTIGSGSESDGAEVDGNGDLVMREAHFPKPRGPDTSPQLTTKPHKRKRDAEVEVNGDTRMKSKKSKKRAEAPTSIATTNANITVSAAALQQPAVPSQINGSNAAEDTMTETRPKKKKKQHALQGRPEDATELLRATSPNAPPPTAPPPPSANLTTEKAKKQEPSRHPPAAPDGPKPIDPHVAASTATESAEDKARRREERRKKKERNRIRDLV